MHNSFRFLRTIFAVLVILFFGSTLAAELVPMPNLVNPNIIEADDSHIYITDDTKIHIYNRKNFKLIKSFGKSGEGPGEFMGSIGSGRAPLDLDVAVDKLLVSSMGKVTLYSKDGKFLQEKKCLDRSRRFIMFKNGFVGNLNKVMGKERFRTLNLYDLNLKNLKILVKRPHTLKPGGGYNPLEGPQVYTAHKGKLYVCWEPGFSVKVFDSSGNLVDTITRGYNKKEVTEEQKKKIDNALKNNPRTKELYPYLKPMKFSEYFPAINNLEVTDGKLYVIGRQDFNDPAQCYIFDLSGKFLKQTKLDLTIYDGRLVYPYCIKGGKVYQLVEDDDEEGWGIRVIDIK